jgi:hypothetical protein
LPRAGNDVSFFKHHRKVEHRHGPSSWQLAPVKKSIYSLIDGRTVKGINFFEPGDSALAACPATSSGQHRPHPPGRASARARDVLAKPAIETVAPVEPRRW